MSSQAIDPSLYWLGEREPNMCLGFALDLARVAPELVRWNSAMWAIPLQPEFNLALLEISNLGGAFDFGLLVPPTRMRNDPEAPRLVRIGAAVEVKRNMFQPVKNYRGDRIDPGIADILRMAGVAEALAAREEEFVGFLWYGQRWPGHELHPAQFRRQEEAIGRIEDLTREYEWLTVAYLDCTGRTSLPVLLGKFG